LVFQSTSGLGERCPRLSAEAGLAAGAANPKFARAREAIIVVIANFILRFCGVDCLVDMEKMTVQAMGRKAGEVVALGRKGLWMMDEKWAGGPVYIHYFLGDIS